MKPVAEYVVYDPPEPGFPYLAILFRPDTRPRVFLFQTFEQATEFVTAQALSGQRRHEMSPDRGADLTDGSSGLSRQH